VSGFVEQTNRLPHSSRKPQASEHPRDRLIASQPIYFTFAGGTQRIILRLDAYGDLTNGYVSASPSCEWEAIFLAIDCVGSPTTLAPDTP